MEKIDELDRKILDIITKNARIPFKDVAEQCGVSRAAVHQRVQRMYDLGVIIGSGYLVNPKSLGYHLCAYVGIILEKGNMYNSAVCEIEKIPEVVESHYTLGSYSILIKLYARDDMHLMSLLSRLQEIPGIAQTETLTALDQRIARTLPIE
ncbi:MAG: AsnC family transcriptional regulator [Paludibacteraceae bacterium]|nr:AsnC family transcriptional regulator [Paludibacteraceae bacterium]